MSRAKKVFPEEAEKMWRLYQELHTYKAVAQALGRDPKTVSAHVKEYEASQRVTIIIQQ